MSLVLLVTRQSPRFHLGALDLELGISEVSVPASCSKLREFFADLLTSELSLVGLRPFVRQKSRPTIHRLGLGGKNP